MPSNFAPSNSAIAWALADAFLAGPLEMDALVERGTRLFGRRRWRWLRPLARRICDAFTGRPRQPAVAQFLLSDAGFLRACEKFDLALVERLAAPPMMAPATAASAWRVPPIRTPSELAAWLGVTVSELEWFADLRSLQTKCRPGPLRHYHYRALTKPGGQVRLLEAPKARLKEIQRRILVDILELIPQHAAAHGFRRGRSIISFAAPHVGRSVVLKIDLRDFFPSISARRIKALFRTAGYPGRVADLLAGLCTTATPLDIWDDTPAASAGREMCNLRRLYAQPHLPQGAPTSPALANLCAYRMDCRLAGLASSAGAVYTRYADDLAFSGDRKFERVVRRFQVHVCATAMEEGFVVHHRKTRIMRDGVRQRLAGVVVNQRVNVPRADYDRLKATLSNCVRHGAESQNREGLPDFQAHLLGRISFVEMIHPERGKRLRELFDRIVW